MSTEPPQLPAFLTQPLTYPIERCVSPERPLPPFSTKIDTIVFDWFLDRIHDELNEMGQILTRSDTSATDNLIFARIENSFTPQQIAQASLNPSSAYLTTPRSTRSTRSLANSDLFVGSGVISALAGMALDVEDYFSSLRYLPASLSGSVITGELGQSRRCRQGRSSGRKEAKGAGGGGAESQPLLNGILEAISKRTIDPTGWGSTESWERDIVLAQLQYLDSAKDYCSSILKADFECLDYRAVMERPGAVHATLDFLRSALRTNPTSSTSSILRKPVSSADSANLPSPNAPPHSLLFHRLSHYASPRFEHLKLPSVHLPHSSSQVLPAPPSAPVSSSTPSAQQSSHQHFNRFERVENNSVDFPQLVRLVTPRFCSPDRCSGRPKYESYELLDRLVKDFFMLGIRCGSLSDTPKHIEEMRSIAMVDIIEALLELDFGDTIDDTTISKATALGCQLLIDRMASTQTYEAPVMGETLGVIFKQLQFYDELREQYVRVIDNTRQSISLAPVDSPALRQLLAPKFEAGDSVGGQQRGERNEQMERVIARLAVSSGRWIVSNHHHFAPSLFRLADTLSAARIIEEVGSIPLNWSPTDPSPLSSGGFNSLTGKDVPDYASSSEGAKRRGDEQLRVVKGGSVHDLASAIDSYQLATIIDPSNFEARLNSAAVRLRLAAHDSTAIQWTRIIYDCSAAIYYGSTSFKAYYRRGYALTHLKLWEKAILGESSSLSSISRFMIWDAVRSSLFLDVDFDQALLIEPGNVLVERCLAAAKRGAVV